MYKSLTYNTIHKFTNTTKHLRICECLKNILPYKSNCMIFNTKYIYASGVRIHKSTLKSHDFHTFFQNKKYNCNLRAFDTEKALRSVLYNVLIDSEYILKVTLWPNMCGVFLNKKPCRDLLKQYNVGLLDSEDVTGICFKSLQR